MSQVSTVLAGVGEQLAAQGLLSALGDGGAASHPRYRHHTTPNSADSKTVTVIVTVTVTVTTPVTALIQAALRVLAMTL